MYPWPLLLAHAVKSRSNQLSLICCLDTYTRSSAYSQIYLSRTNLANFVLTLGPTRSLSIYTIYLLPSYHRPAPTLLRKIWLIYPLTNVTVTALPMIELRLAKGNG